MGGSSSGLGRAGRRAMYDSSYSSRRSMVAPPYLGPTGLSGLGGSPAHQGPGYSSPAGQARYRDYSNSRFSEVTAYSTPVNYSSRSLRAPSLRPPLPPSLRAPSLRRGNSLEPTPSSPAYPEPAFSCSSLSRASSATRQLPSSSDLLSDYLKSSSRHAINREVESPARHRQVPGRGMLQRQQSVEVTGARREDRDPRDHTRYFTPREKLEAFRAQPYREKRPVSCDKVYNGIMIGNGETIQSIGHLKGLGVTHVLNTAEQHVEVSLGAYSLNKIQYYGFHVDDLPHANISRHFRRTTEFIGRAVESGGLVVVNCYMGLSRSATCVIAYLMMKQNMTCKQALELISQGRKVRPNPGFLQQLADLEHTLRLSGRFARY